MKPEIKSKWVAALRSGEFKQGTGWLLQRNHNETQAAYYCCLGVLCELHRRETNEGEWKPEGCVTIYSTNRDSSLIDLPYGVHQWAGLKRMAPKDKDNVGLDERNDAGMTFAQIADIIERDL